MFGGHDNQLETFLKHEMLGKGPRNAQIRAIDIVKDVDPEEWRAYVEWRVTDLLHKVPLKGNGGLLHGPYDRSKVEAVFCV